MSNSVIIVNKNSHFLILVHFTSHCGLYSKCGQKLKIFNYLFLSKLFYRESFFLFNKKKLFLCIHIFLK